MNGPKLILASGSPRRRELLQAWGLEYAVATSNVDEEAIAAGARQDHPEEIVTRLAEAKAREIARREPSGGVVIGADTIVWLNGRALNKPKDIAEAVRMLTALQGRAHQVYTGVALVASGECSLRPALLDWASTEVEFRPLTQGEIEAYVATGEPMDKAGAYGIQSADGGARLVSKVTGDYYNVVGLPLATLRALLLPQYPDLPPVPESPLTGFPVLSSPR